MKQHRRPHSRREVSTLSFAFLCRRLSILSYRRRIACARYLVVRESAAVSGTLRFTAPDPRRSPVSLIGTVSVNFRETMRGMRTLSMCACFAAVTSFAPFTFQLSQKRYTCSAVANLDAKPSSSPVNLQSQSTTKEDTVSCNASGGGNMASRPRAALPVVLVGSDRSILETFARHLTADDASSVVDLGEVTKSDGARGVEITLNEGKVSKVLTCPSKVCLEHPDVTSLVRAYPLTVHLAVDGEDAEERRRCERVTKYTIMVDNDSSNHDFAKVDLSRLVAFARKPKPSREEVKLDLGKNTFFLSLTFEDFAPHVDLLQDLTDGVNALELRVDLLSNYDPYSVLQQLSILRRNTNYLPVVFTIRSKGQCGAFPEDPDALFSLARWGLRAGCEVIDVESNWPMSHRKSFIRDASLGYPGAILIGSYHVVGQKTTDEEARALFTECYHDGTVDAVKVVTTAFEWQDSNRVHNAAQSLSLPVPYIGLCLTETGKLSRVLNEIFTPVTHEKLPFVAAPGQLSSREIMRLRADLGICPPRSFFLFGSPISASPSPDMHNAGFRVSGLPHEYSLCEGEDPAVMAEALARPEFGGASVTIPHKQNILPLLDEVSDAAEKIGAVNTVIVGTNQATGARRLLGDNTDWLGIMKPVKARLMATGWEEGRKGVALVVGAGGAAMGALFAMQRLGLRVMVYNRTPSKAEELAARFGGAAVSALDAETVQAAFGTTSVDVVVSTIPAAAGFTLPESLLLNKPVVFDAAYKPALTPLLAQAKEAGCPYVQGAEMLVEQGLEQFQLWTGRRAPRQAMEAAVFAKVDRI